MCRRLFPFWGSHNMALPSSFFVPRNFPIDFSFCPTTFFSLLYFFFPYPYSNFAINSLGNFQLNSFSSSSSCSYCLNSSASSLYSLSNSSTSSFTFFKFSLFFQVSSSAVYPFYLTKNFFSPLPFFCLEFFLL